MQPGTQVAMELAEDSGREAGTEPTLTDPCIQLCTDWFHLFTYYPETISVKLVIILIL